MMAIYGKGLSILTGKLMVHLWSLRQTQNFQLSLNMQELFVLSHKLGDPAKESNPLVCGRLSS